MSPNPQPPDEAFPIDAERGISPISGRLPGWKGKIIPLAALALGCGVLLIASWRGVQPASTPTEAIEGTSTRPVFEAARRPSAASAVEALGETTPVEAAGPPIPALESPPSAAGATLSRHIPAARDSLLVVSVPTPAAPPHPGEPASGAGRTRSDVSVAFRVGPRDLHLLAGSIVPCVLQTALDSSTPGPVGCTLPRDVYSDTGSVVVLPRGTRVLGEYRSSLRQGRRRLHVLWTRMITPDGVVVSLESPAGDPLGRVGLDGRVDSRFWSRLGDALLQSLVEQGTLQARRSRIDLDAADLDQDEDEFDRRPAVLSRAQGTEVSILVSRDIDFSTVFHLRAP